MFVVVLQYVQPLPVIDQALDAHRAFLDRQYAAGLFLASGPLVPRTGGVILATGVSRPALETVLGEDPFAQAHLAEYQIHEFQPTRAAVGAEVLLSQEVATTAESR
jgi:uncharacterized protein YciI